MPFHKSNEYTVFLALSSDKRVLCANRICELWNGFDVSRKIEFRIHECNALVVLACIQVDLMWRILLFFFLNKYVQVTSDNDDCKKCIETD